MYQSVIGRSFLHIIIIIIIIERFIDSENDGRQVEIIKQINSYANNNKFKKKTL